MRESSLGSTQPWQDYGIISLPLIRLWANWEGRGEEHAGILISNFSDMFGSD